MAITDAEAETGQMEALLARARAGDAEAFCQLAAGHEERLLRQATALCGDLATAEDIVQQTLLAAWKSLPNFNGACQLSTWLYTILLRRYQNVLRARRCRPVALSALPGPEAAERESWLDRLPTGAAGPAEILERQEQASEWRRCVAALPEAQREAVWLRFFEDASLEEIARALDCSVGTVKSRLHHGLEKLRQMKHCVNLARPGGDQ